MINNAPIRAQTAALSSWAGSIGAGVAANAPIVQLLNRSYNDNGVIVGDTVFLRLLRMEVTLTTAAPTSVCLQKPSSTGSYLVARLGLRTTNQFAIDKADDGLQLTTQPAVATSWSSAPAIRTVNSFSYQVGFLQSVGDKLVWEWPEDAPLFLNYATDDNSLALFNKGGGVTGGLDIFMLYQQLPDFPLLA